MLIAARDKAENKTKQNKKQITFGKWGVFK